VVKSAQHKYLYCCLVLIAVFALEPITVPDTATLGFYLFNAFIDYTAILFLIPAHRASCRTATLLIWTYGIFIAVHAVGWVAYEFGITLLYNMYPITLFVIMAIQLIIMAMGYGDTKRKRRANKRDRSIPAVVVASSFDSNHTKEGS